MKVIGITGSVGSGKSSAMKILLSHLNAKSVTLSTIIRGELEHKKKGISREDLINMGNQMRRQYGTHILAKLAVEYLSRDTPYIIIDGIRNPGEAQWFKKTFGTNFLLIGVDAPKELRWERVQKRGVETDVKTYDEFLQIDDGEQGIGENEYGQQVTQCIKMADAVVQNDGNETQLEEKLRTIMRNWQE